MAGFLSQLTHYVTNGWSEANRELLSEFDPEGFEELESAEVVEKEQSWGTSVSVCLFSKGGSDMAFIPLSRDSKLRDHVGEEVDLDSIEVITLERDGDDDIYKADGDVKAKKARRATRSK